MFVFSCVQLDLARERDSEEKMREYLWRGAEAYDRCGHLESAEEQLHELLECELSKEQKLEALCFLADVQVREPSGKGDWRFQLVQPFGEGGYHFTECELSKRQEAGSALPSGRRAGTGAWYCP